MTFLQAAGPKGMSLKSDISSSGPTVLGNSHQIQQILTNLVTNAWEAADENQTVINVTVKTVFHMDISATKRFPIDWQPTDTAYACLEVADTGMRDRV